MNPAAILGLLGDLYSQVAKLTEENQELRRRLELASTAKRDGEVLADLARDMEARR